MGAHRLTQGLVAIAAFHQRDEFAAPGTQQVEQSNGHLADVGTDLAVADQQTSVLDDVTLNLKSTLSDVEDLDFAAAVTKMNKQMLSLEAAQASFAKIAKLNLFNYIN